VWEKDLEDAVHDVFLVVHRHLGDYDPSRPLRPWVTGIAYRVAANYRRRAAHRHEVAGDPPPDAASAQPRPDDVVQQRQAAALVQRALDDLEEGRRAVFVLHELEGHAVPEVARMLEVPVNTAYSRLRLARAQFTAAVRRLTGTGSDR
jgi:RNA polymerase sigma-70 factor (ECF subfamily)